MTDRIWDGDFFLFNYDPVSGVETWVRDDDGIWTVRKVVPVNDLMDLNAMQRSLNEGTRHGDGMTKMASIPMNLYYKHLAEPMREGDDKAVKKWLNDLDNQKFRTRDGKA